jgi:hypothetical protein
VSESVQAQLSDGGATKRPHCAALERHVWSASGKRVHSHAQAAVPPHSLPVLSCSQLLGFPFIFLSITHSIFFILPHGSTSPCLGLYLQLGCSPSHPHHFWISSSRLLYHLEAGPKPPSPSRVCPYPRIQPVSRPANSQTTIDIVIATLRKISNLSLLLSCVTLKSNKHKRGQFSPVQHHRRFHQHH